jgi:hypothetical protein
MQSFGFIWDYSIWSFKFYYQWTAKSIMMSAFANAGTCSCVSLLSLSRLLLVEKLHQFIFSADPCHGAMVNQALLVTLMFLSVVCPESGVVT